MTGGGQLRLTYLIFDNIAARFEQNLFQLNIYKWFIFSLEDNSGVGQLGVPVGLISLTCVLYSNA